MGESGPRSFAEILNDLCTHPANRATRYTNVELARIVRGKGGEITHTYISQLRKGDKDNPSCRTIKDLADALEVHPAYFVGGRRDRAPGERPRWRADALRQLFAMVHPAGRGPFSVEEVATSISRDGQYGAISASYIRELLAGTSDSPRLKHVQGLAEHFGAPAAYFFDVELAARIDAQLETHRAMDRLGVNTVIMRAAEHLPRAKVRREILKALAHALHVEITMENTVAPVLLNSS